MDRRGILVGLGILLAAIDLTIEIKVLPLLYEGVPIPFPSTAKPIGNVLFSATFLHLTLIAINLIVVLAVMNRLGYRSSFLPSKSSDWIDLSAFLIMAISGLLMWFYPIAFLFFLGSGIYIVLADMR
ncbi:MAG: hypothetical protein QXI59_04200 [Candidatus Bathyarchaeia archaeon]|nr:hypothetical protein [Candidatus Bathyarchaeota archaeon]